VLVIGKKVPENRGVRKFCMSAQIDTDLSPYIPIIPVFGCSLPEASRLFFPFPFGLLLEHNTVVKRERERAEKSRVRPCEGGKRE